MSDYIPFHLQIEIIKRLPVRSLLQSRLVSKTWKAFIDSPEFLAGYGVRQTQPPLLLIRYKDIPYREEKYICVVDDDHFVRQDFAPTFPDLMDLLSDSMPFGSSHGLFCSYGQFQDPSDSSLSTGIDMAVLWNPSIRKSVGVVIPDGDAIDFPSQTVLGFGVCPISSDPTIVKITHVGLGGEERNRFSPWQVQSFTLSSGSWRVLSINLPSESIKVTWSQAVIDRFIYWFSFDRIFATIDVGIVTNNLILSFDLTTHEFRVVDLPDSLSQQHFINLSISKLRDSLGVFEYKTNYTRQLCDVWVMEDGVTRSFRRMFTISSPYEFMRILGFANNGNPIMETIDEIEDSAAIEVYEPSSQQINDLEIYAEDNSYFVSPYMETLLLLDKRDCSIYS